MARRARKHSAVSLFAFQDIITSVTAVIILITLILTVELISRTTASTEAIEASSATVSPLEEAIERAHAEIEQLETQIERKSGAINRMATMSPRQLQEECAALQRLIEDLRHELEKLAAQQRAAALGMEQAVARAADDTSLRQQAARLRAQAVAFRAEASRLQRDKTLIFNSPPGSRKRAWLVDVSAERIAVLPLTQHGQPVKFSGGILTSPTSSFRRWTKKRDPSQEYFVLLVRPSGVSAFDDLRHILEQGNFQIGFDLIGKDETITTSKASRSSS